MARMNDNYYSTYCRLDCDSAEDHVALNGNRPVIGGELVLKSEVHVNERGKEVPRVQVWIDDEFQAGFLPHNVAMRVMELEEKGWLCRAISAVVAYSRPEESYWMQAAVICYNPADESERAAFEGFFQKICERMGKGEHPKIDLAPEQVEQVLSSGGTWCETGIGKLPHMPKGNAIFKKEMTQTERLAQQAVKDPKGCYVKMAICTVVVIAIVVAFWFLH